MLFPERYRRDDGSNTAPPPSFAVEFNRAFRKLVQGVLYLMSPTVCFALMIKDDARRNNQIRFDTARGCT